MRTPAQKRNSPPPEPVLSPAPPGALTSPSSQPASPGPAPENAGEAGAARTDAAVPSPDFDFSRIRIYPDVSPADPIQAFRAPDFGPVHAIRQRGRMPRIQRVPGDGGPHSNRFQGSPELKAAYDNGAPVQRGASGLHVTILQQALVDAGFSLPRFGVDGIFGPETRAVVRAFQTSKGLAGPAGNGVVNGNTMNLLDQHFLGHAPERAIAANAGRPVMEGTRPLSATERAGVTQAITTEPQAAGGAAPVFHQTIATNPDPYEVRIERALNEEITAEYDSMVATRLPRTPANLMTPATIDGLAQRAKGATDAVFGRYKAGPPLAYGVNILDQFEVRDAEIAASAANADAAARWRVQKILSGDETIGTIDQEHGAVQSRAAESALITPIFNRIVAARRAELLDIHRNWPASAGEGAINLRRSLETGNAANRDLMYDTFATIIHEYIHTLEHPNHVNYREGLDERRGGFVLREGMTDYFAKMVWDGITFDAALRAAIEGTFQDPANPTGHPIPSPENSRYPEWTNAERAVGIVGIRNAMAAFFLGQTGLIGG